MESLIPLFDFGPKRIRSQMTPLQSHIKLNKNIVNLQ